MLTSIHVGGPAGSRDTWNDTVTLVREAERLGVDMVWSAEAWGADAVSPLGYLAAVTERVTLGTSIMQISARSPAMAAMTALTLARMTDNRFILGLGVSGPQVVEGLHNTRFAQPLARLREYVSIVRSAFAGEKINHQGEHYQLPMPDGPGKSLRLAFEPNPNIPIWLATLGPKSLAFTGEAADGWAGTAFVPSGAANTIGLVREAAKRSGRDHLAYEAGGAVCFGDDLDALMEPRRPGIAFTLAAMGSPTQNFYNDAYSRAGYAEAAARVRELYLSGDRRGAAAAIPAELILETNFLGDTAAVTERVQAYADAGITVLRCQPEGDTFDERLDVLGQLVDITKAIK